MNKIVCVVRGGVSHESDKSVIYGQKVIKNLQDLGFVVRDLYLHHNGTFTIDGIPKKVEEIFPTFDFVWNCLVGVDGESGLVEELCEKNNVKLLGHKFISTKLASDKRNFAKIANNHNLKTPYSGVVRRNGNNKEDILKVFATVGIPAVVKPINGSGLQDVHVANNFTQLEMAVNHILGKDQDVLVEKMLKGVPVSVFVMEHGELMHTNIHVYENQKIEKSELIKIRNEALYLHEVLAFPHHVEYDFVYTNKGIYLIEVNTHPSLVHGYIHAFFRDNVVSLKDYLIDKFKINK
jgi:D-alanine-D-alanine ligase-like ATP-grasp enzyme